MNAKVKKLKNFNLSSENRLKIPNDGAPKNQMSEPGPARCFDSKSSRYHEDNARVAANTKLEIVRWLSVIVDR